MGLGASVKFPWVDLTEKSFSLDTYILACAKDCPWFPRPHNGSPHFYIPRIKCPPPRSPEHHQYAWYERPLRPRYQGKRNRDADQTKKRGTSGQREPTTPQRTANNFSGRYESPGAHHASLRPGPATSDFSVFRLDPIPLVHEEVPRIESHPYEGGRF